MEYRCLFNKREDINTMEEGIGKAMFSFVIGTVLLIILITITDNWGFVYWLIQSLSTRLNK